MSKAPSHLPVKYIATIDDAQEVTLFCNGDYAYWQSRLETEGLTVAHVDGRAEIWLSAVQLQWMGVRFSELSISVRLEGDAEIFLVAAFSTSRAFAFMERLFFQTPYCHAHVNVECNTRPAFALHVGNEVDIAAQRHVAAHDTTCDHKWKGRIWLPSKRATLKRKYFLARLCGETHVSPFIPESDTLVVQRSSLQVVSMLADSGVRGIEWRIRPNASHARSKTYSE